MLERQASSAHDSGWSGIDFVSITHGLIVAECLSFRRAAKVLGVRQSTVSRRVRSLEAAGAAGRGENGTLRVGIFSSIAAGFLRELLRSYAERHPDVGLQISEGGLREHVALIAKGRMDVAFAMGTTAVPNCEIAQLWTERLFVALPTGHALCERGEVDWADLRDQHFIVRQSEAGLAMHDHVIKRLSDLGHHPSVQRLEVSRETLVHLVAPGLGVGFTSEAAVAISFPGVVFRPMAGDAEILPFSAIWSRGNDNPAFRRFLSLARTMAKKQKQLFVTRAAGLASGLMNRDSMSLCLSSLVVHVQMLDLWT